MRLFFSVALLACMACSKSEIVPLNYYESTRIGPGTSSLSILSNNTCLLDDYCRDYVSDGLYVDPLEVPIFEEDCVNMQGEFHPRASCKRLSFGCVTVIQGVSENPPASDLLKGFTVVDWFETVDVKDCTYVIDQNLKILSHDDQVLLDKSKRSFFARVLHWLFLR